jgi:hypothetical protein
MTAKAKKNSTSLLKTPIIGVFVSPCHITKLNQQCSSFMSSSRYIRYIELAKASKKAKVKLYFFSNKDVHIKQRKITGTSFYHKKKIWKKDTFPFPDVLYDRGGGGGTKKSQFIRKTFKKRDIKKINIQHYFDKWDLFWQLNKLEEMRPHLPLTVKGKIKDLNKMMTGLPKFYIKARKGSCGNGVVRVICLNQQTYQYSYMKDDRLVVRTVKKYTNLLKKLHSFFKQKEVIVQEAIDLPQMYKGIIDMRAEAQRNKKGNISITAITVRIGRPNSPIASNTLPSKYYPFERFFRDIFKYPKEDIKKLRKKISAFLVKVYKCVECSYGPFGDLGIDFGIDTKGHLWLIECNAKSAKVALYQAYDRKTIRKAFRNPLEYAKLLVRE